MEKTKQVAEEKMSKAVHALQEEFKTVRTGRASAALFEKIRVEYYGQKVPINQVATLSIPEARQVIIQPWDRAVLTDIEKAIQRSELSVNPVNDGKIIRINIPPLTEERRKDLVKVAKGMAEKARISIRNIRRDTNEELKKMQKDSAISEDDAKRGIDEVQKRTDKYIEDINRLLDEKEKEILEV